MLIVLIAIYTLTLCIGTITANILSQGYSLQLLFMLPYGLAITYWLVSLLFTRILNFMRKHKIENQYVCNFITYKYIFTY